MIGVLLVGGLGGCPTPDTSSSERTRVLARAIDLPVGEKPIFRSEPIFDAIGARSGSHGSTITALPDGTLLAAWYSYVGPGERDGAAVYMSRRAVGASGWDEPVVHIEDSKAHGNPVLYAEGENVWLFHCATPGAWGLAHIERERSGDGGATWSVRRTIDGPTGSCTRSPPIRLHDGAMLLPAYSDLVQQSHFFISRDDGESWELLSSIFTNPPAQNLQPSLAPLSDGRIIAVMRNQGRGFLWQATTANDGRTWSSATDSGFPNPGSAAMLLRLASGNLALIFNDSDRERWPLSISLSPDDGGTWTEPREIESANGTWDYPSAAQAADGLIHITYTANRERIIHVELNEAWIVATSDAGQSP